jgi:hypothetical protein
LSGSTDTLIVLLVLAVVATALIAMASVVALVSVGVGIVTSLVSAVGSVFRRCAGAARLDSDIQADGDEDRLHL